MPNFPIKVLLVEDSPIASAILQRILKSTSEISVVGTASNGKEAIALISKLNPDVICTDLYMSGMNGLEFTQQVMKNYPRPILVISNAVQKKDKDNIFQLLRAGAIDVFPKPITGLDADYERSKNDLITKIKIVSGVTVFTKSSKYFPVTTECKNELMNGRSLAQKQYLTTPRRRSKSTTIKAKISKQTDYSQIKFITIGVSTGGPKSLYKIFTQLPKNFPLPIICTLHISNGFISGLVAWLNRECSLTVKVAVAGELPLPGTIYFAPDNFHLEINSQGRFSCLRSELVDGHCPSVTVMMQSLARFHGENTIAILLTGMGQDGAAGMKSIAEAGGITIAQDEQSCVVFGMPKEAISLGAVRHILSLVEIAPFLLDKLMDTRSD